MTELGNESEIHNASILLFPATEKQDISPSQPNPPFKSWSLISHEDKLSESFREFKSVKLISPENRRLPRSFNNRASHTNKRDKSNNNDLMYRSHVTTYHLKPLDKLSGANFQIL